MHPSAENADRILVTKFIKDAQDGEDLLAEKAVCYNRPETQERFGKLLFKAVFRNADLPERSLNDVLEAPDIADRERALGMLGMMKMMYGADFDYDRFERMFNYEISHTIF